MIVINKEEIIKRLLQKSICVNSGMDGCYNPYSTDEEWYNDIDNLVNIYERLEQENKQLKDNWNKLKEYIKSDGVSYLNLADERCFCNKKEAKYILNKMQELEGSDGGEC